MTFKVPRGGIFKVTIFDHTMIEEVQRYPQHDIALAMIDE
jgi:hypothetical protein